MGKTTYDVDVRNYGTVVVFAPLTAEGFAWMDANLKTESWQWLGNTLGVDYRMAPAISEGMENDGLSLEYTGLPTPAQAVSDALRKVGHAEPV